MGPHHNQPDDFEDDSLTHTEVRPGQELAEMTNPTNKLKTQETGFLCQI